MTIIVYIDCCQSKLDPFVLHLTLDLSFEIVSVIDGAFDPSGRVRWNEEHHHFLKEAKMFQRLHLCPFRCGKPEFSIICSLTTAKYNTVGTNRCRLQSLETGFAELQALPFQH